MRLSEPIETFGVFWLPEYPDDQLPGTLRISQSGEVTLELRGGLEAMAAIQSRASNDDLDRIVGVVYPKLRPDEQLGQASNGDLDRIVEVVEKGGLVTGGLVTLDKCILWKEGPSHIYFKEPPLSALAASLSTLVIHASYAFIRKNYDKGEEITFLKFRFSVEGLDEWLSISGIREGPDLEKTGWSLQYHAPEKISHTLPDEIELEFKVYFDGTRFTYPGKVHVEEKAFIYLQSQELRPIEYFLSLASKFRNFLCLAVDQTVAIDSCTGYLTREIENGETIEDQVELYYQSGQYSEERPRIIPRRKPLAYCYIADQFDQILTKWLEIYETHEPAFNLYFAYRSNSVNYLQVQFLWLAQAIEILHRRGSTNTQIDKNEFRKLVDLLLQCCPENKKEWIKGKLQYANELSLRERIREIIDPFQHLFSNDDEREAFIKRVVNTRNYLTHYSRRQNPTDDYQVLWMLCQKLEILIRLHLLRLIGVDNESFNSQVQKIWHSPSEWS